jgi:hypothetical protein
VATVKANPANRIELVSGGRITSATMEQLAATLSTIRRSAADGAKLVVFPGDFLRVERTLEQGAEGLTVDAVLRDASIRVLREQALDSGVSVLMGATFEREPLDPDRPGTPQSRIIDRGILLIDPRGRTQFFSLQSPLPGFAPTSATIKVGGVRIAVQIGRGGAGVPAGADLNLALGTILSGSAPSLGDRWISSGWVKQDQPLDLGLVQVKWE